MGLLSQDYYNKVLNNTQPIVPATPPPVANNNQPETQPGFIENVENRLLTPMEISEQKNIKLLETSGQRMGDAGKIEPVQMLSREEQIRKFGGEIGSVEYLKF